MRIFLVKYRLDVEVWAGLFKDLVLEVIELLDGRHNISHAGLTVPIKISGNGAFVTIYLADAEGNLSKGSIGGMGDDWSFADPKCVIEIILRTEEGSRPLIIFEDEKRVYLELEARNNPPVAITSQDLPI